MAETTSPGTFFGRQETLPLMVDDKGYTRIDREHGRPVVSGDVQLPRGRYLKVLRAHAL